MGLLDKIKGAFRTSGGPGKPRERPPKPPEEKPHRCITCGRRISEREHEDNAGQCDNCVLEDTGTAMIYDLEE